MFDVLSIVMLALLEIDAHRLSVERFVVWLWLFDGPGWSTFGRCSGYLGVTVLKLDHCDYHVGVLYQTIQVRPRY